MSDIPGKSAGVARPEFWRWLHLHPAITYSGSLTLVLLIFVLRDWFAPTLGSQALYLFLVPPVLLAGILGGWGPGVLATLLAMSLQIFITGDYRTLAKMTGPLFAVDLARTITFAVVGVTIAWF